ncbi:hypothetical protein BpHYR1_026583 [Brachionus plicatilis]|uniref:Uncharacterized protein n=1 Tax=Brachionus plicatilis TaxID=10195 RepID=A0A3M7S211_BRAPC|nr:hypothetical protein BpHYR1_026583 [Brachionus plicatilis]
MKPATANMPFSKSQNKFSGSLFTLDLINSNCLFYQPKRHKVLIRWVDERGKLDKASLMIVQYFLCLQDYLSHDYEPFLSILMVCSPSLCVSAVYNMIPDRNCRKCQLQKNKKNEYRISLNISGPLIFEKIHIIDQLLFQ